MADQFGDKQHEATPHRRQQARERGQLARSQDLTSAIMLLGAIGVFRLLGERLVALLAALSRRNLDELPAFSTDASALVALWHGLMAELGPVVLLMLGLMFLLTVLLNLAQVGFLFLPSKLAFDFSRLDPLQGLRRLFSLSSAVRLGFGIFKVGVVGTVAVVSLWNERSAILELSALEVFQIAEFLVDVIFGTCFKVGLALLVLAILDYGYQRWKHEQDLRMTTQEVREELKQLQGDPQVAARRRAVQRQLTLNRIRAAVPQADVVVTNPTELAIAIQYEHSTMEAPVVVAKGAGTVAARIRRLALEHAVPIVERKDLARALYKHVEIGKPIPAEQYTAMAEVLRYVYQLKGKTLPELDAA